MRFRSRSTRTPYLSRRDQLRMLGLVFALALVMIGIKVASDPAMYRWLFPAAEKEAATNEPPRRPEPDDYRVEPESDDLPPDAFRSPVAEQEPAEWPSDAELTLDVRDPHLDRELLAVVRDNTLGIRRDEADVFYRILVHIRDLNPEQLAEAARSDLVYTHLMVQPDRYRGELVTMTGDIRRIRSFEAGPNRYGIDRLYEAWLFTADSGVHPIRIVFSELPDDLQPSETMALPARVTGYFFKREGYNTPGGLHVAPVLLARSVQPRRVTIGSVPATKVELTPYVLAIVIAVGTGLAAMLWSFRRDARRLDRERLERLKTPSDGIRDLPPVESLTVEEQLRRLAEGEHTAD